MRDSLRRLVLAAATMPEDRLHDARREVEALDYDKDVKQLVLKVIDLFISAGDDAELRARIALGCLEALGRLQES
jgi:hypothetical protein